MTINSDNFERLDGRSSDVVPPRALGNTSSSTFKSAPNGLNDDESFEKASNCTPRGVDENFLDWCDDASVELNGSGLLLEDFEGVESISKLPLRKLPYSKLGDPWFGDQDLNHASADLNCSPRSTSRHKRPTILSILSPAQLEEELEQTKHFLAESMKRSELSRRQLDRQGSTSIMLIPQSFEDSLSTIRSYVKEVSSMALG